MMIDSVVENNPAATKQLAQIKALIKRSNCTSSRKVTGTRPVFPMLFRAIYQNITSDGSDITSCSPFLNAKSSGALPAEEGGVRSEEQEKRGGKRKGEMICTCIMSKEDCRIKYQLLIF